MLNIGSKNISYLQEININEWKSSTSIINLCDYEIKSDFSGLVNYITLNPNYYSR